MGNAFSSPPKRTKTGSVRTKYLFPRKIKQEPASHVTQTSGWLPPADSWEGNTVPGSAMGLPYGWEAAIDKEGRTYYVNHLNKTTTYEDPRKWATGVLESEENPEPRSVTLKRDQELGFGFVAGSEKPVIVRFVTSGGPSVGHLMPGDQILQINGEDVKMAPRDHVIQLVRNCRESVSLVVCQPPLDNSSTRKSALLSAAKKAKLKSNPSRVRFAESVDINGSPLHNGPGGTHSQMTSSDSVMPLMPNVLKVFLENGQTKSFKYDTSTTVQDVIDSLQAKLGLRTTSYFSLVVEHIKSLRRNKLTILDPKERLSTIASRPGAHNLRCLFRVTFVPTDAYALLREDSVAFEYLYVQCCNDVVQERFAPELKYDIALRLAALHIHQHVLSNAQSEGGSGSLTSATKVTVKAVEKECGLDRFVPASLAESMKRKELRKLLTHFLKLNATTATSLNGAGSGSSGQKAPQLTALQAKLHYLKIIAELPSYGAKCFSTNISDSNVETVILISPKFGVSQINSLRNSVVKDVWMRMELDWLSTTIHLDRERPLNLCDIEQVTSVVITKEDEISQKVDIHLKDPEKENITLSLEDRDAQELVLVLTGYFKLLAGRELEIIQQKTEFTQQQAPVYCSKHLVTPQGWNYPNSPGVVSSSTGHPHSTSSEEGSSASSTASSSMEHSQQSHRDFIVDLGGHPPYHPPPEGFRMPQTGGGGGGAGAGGNGNSGGIMGPFSSDSGSDADSSMTSMTAAEMVERQQGVDRNRNFTLEDNANLNNTATSRPLFSTFKNNLNSLSQVSEQQQMRRSTAPSGGTLVPNGILKKPPRAPPSSAASTPKRNLQQKASEARNDAVIRRVSELSSLVDSEGSSGQSNCGGDTDSQGGSSTTSGSTNERIRHSDSLLMLGQDAEDDEELLHEAVNKSLHLSKPKSLLAEGTGNTPDTTPARRQPASNLQIQSRLKPSGSSFGLHSPDNLPGLQGFGAVNQQGEVQDYLKKLKSSSKSLVLDPDLIDLTMIPPPMTPDEDGVYRVLPGTASAVSTPPTPFADRQTLEAELKALEQEGGHVSGYPPEQVHSSSSALAAVYQLKDIESFIANTTVPPPPSASSASSNSSGGPLQPSASASDLSAFIIPPPPIPAAALEASSLPRSHGRISSDRELQEVKVQPPAPPARAASEESAVANKEKIISPKIASLQQRLMSPDREASNAEFKGINDTLTRRNKSVPVEGSPVRSILRRAENGGKTSSVPPPPPPRTTVPRPELIKGLQSASTASKTVVNGSLPSYQFGSNGKSEDIPQRPNPSGLKLPLKSTEPSKLQEDEVPKKASPGSPQHKLSLTSSSDSLSSNASVNTVKSVSPVDEADSTNGDPPSLPPRLSPVKTVATIGPKPHLPDPESKDRAMPPDSPKPALPSRATKPASPVKNSVAGGLRSLPRVPSADSKPVVNGSGKAPAPLPGTSSTIVKVNGGDVRPELPQKTLSASERLPGGRKLPMPPPSQAAPTNGDHAKVSNGKLPNGKLPPDQEVYSNSEFDPEDTSLEGTCVDDDDQLTEDARLNQANRVLVFRRAEGIIVKIVEHIRESEEICAARIKANKSSNSGNVERYERAREALTNESRHFVTASKLFVKSATESEGQLLECLNHCVQMMERIANVTHDVAECNPDPPQTRALIMKVYDVADTYLETVRAAGAAIGKGMNDPTMNVLMKKATALASVLTTLMRSLRVFS